MEGGRNLRDHLEANEAREHEDVDANEQGSQGHGSSPFLQGLGGRTVPDFAVVSE